MSKALLTLIVPSYNIEEKLLEKYNKNERVGKDYSLKEKAILSPTLLHKEYFNCKTLKNA